MSISKRSSWQIQKAVIHALFIRELKTRFGHYRLGYAWALLEPLAHILVLTTIFSVVGRDAVHGIPFFLFLAVGIVPFLFFSKLVSQGLGSINSNRGLMVYRQVRPLDPLIARFFLELVIFCASFTTLLLLFSWAGVEIHIHNLLGILVTLLVLSLFGLGVSLIFAVIGCLYSEASKVVSLCMRPMYFISGIMFPLSMIPLKYHPYLTWNPVLHAIELSREAIFKNYESPSVSLTYLSLSALTALTLGMLCYRSSWSRLIASR